MHSVAKAQVLMRLAGLQTWAALVMEDANNARHRRHMASSVAAFLKRNLTLSDLSGPQFPGYIPYIVHIVFGTRLAQPPSPLSCMF